LPALAIGMEPTDKKLLQDEPRDPKVGIMTKDFVLHLLGYGFMIAIVTMVAFYVGLSESTAMASTMAFATLTLARLFHGFNCRSNQSIFRIGFMSNRWSVGAFALGVIFLGVVLLVPFMKELFFVSSLSGVQLVYIIGLSIIPSVLIQITRLVRK